MEGSIDAPLCRRCGIAVVRNRGSYLTFEHMHQICFHLEFEHQSGELPLGLSDPDAACSDPRCPASALMQDPVPNYDIKSS